MATWTVARSRMLVGPGRKWDAGVSALIVCTVMRFQSVTTSARAEPPAKTISTSGIETAFLIKMPSLCGDRPSIAVSAEQGGYLMYLGAVSQRFLYNFLIISFCTLERSARASAWGGVEQPLTGPRRLGCYRRP